MQNSNKRSSTGPSGTPLKTGKGLALVTSTFASRVQSVRKPRSKSSGGLDILVLKTVQLRSSGSLVKDLHKLKEYGMLNLSTIICNGEAIRDGQDLSAIIAVRGGKRA